MTITDIGEDNALICMTNLTDCMNDEGGEWKFPNGSNVGTIDEDGDFYSINRTAQLVSLHRRNNARGPLGLYCCWADLAMHCINIGK